MICLYSGWLDIQYRSFGYLNPRLGRTHLFFFLKVNIVDDKPKRVHPHFWTMFNSESQGFTIWKEWFREVSIDIINGTCFIFLHSSPNRNLLLLTISSNCYLMYSDEKAFWWYYIYNLFPDVNKCYDLSLWWHMSLIYPREDNSKVHNY